MRPPTRGAPPSAPPPNHLYNCFWYGDGRGGRETRIGSAPTATVCATMVALLQPSANGATWDHSGHGCWAEFGMTGRHHTRAYWTCPFCTTSGWSTGDGTGGRETRVGRTATQNECVALVKAAHPTANGATRGSGSGTQTCYAEFGMTGQNSNSAYRTCRALQL